ncbi:MAG: DUF2891 domain-containing protein [Pseudomonadota bacterium]
MTDLTTAAVLALLLLGLGGCQTPGPQAPAAPVAPLDTELSAAQIERLIGLALDCVHEEYPNVLLHALNADADAQPPRALHPAFYGCFDWHSAVHGHWLLARLAHRYPEHDSAPAAREALFISLTRSNLEGELAYFEAPGRQSFERPYGLAWLLQLDAELLDWTASGDPLAERLSSHLQPLVELAAERLLSWLPRLTFPIRSGTHSQSAFAMGLLHDWATATGREAALAQVSEEARRLYLGDRQCPLGYEPSGHDFLSPCLATADLLRRVLRPTEFSRWLTDFLPQLDGHSSEWLSTATVSDPTDGHLVHLDGLNLSRAWMLRGIASALPPDDERQGLLAAAADAHRKVGMMSIIDPDYAGGHWLGSFATYLVTDRGLSQP